MDAGFAAALLLALAGLVGGLAGPALIARIPEPEPEPDSEPDPEREPEPEPEPKRPKELYVDIAARPGLALRLGTVAAVAGALVGWRLGWTGALVPWAYMVPIGVILAHVDWRTRLLPTAIMLPSYGIVVALLGVAAALDRDIHPFITALIAAAVLRAFYWVLWYVNGSGLGFGDVRAITLIGAVLGYVSWYAVAVGGFAGVFLGALGGVPIAVWSELRSRHETGRRGREIFRAVMKYPVPFGPFLFLGGLVGVLVGTPLLRSLGY